MLKPKVDLTMIFKERFDPSRSPEHLKSQEFAIENDPLDENEYGLVQDDGAKVLALRNEPEISEEEVSYHSGLLE